MLNPQFLAASIFALGLAPDPARNSMQTAQRTDDRREAFDPDGEAILSLPTKTAQGKAPREPGMK
jgi:hypothetical protein